ncbi:amino acid adenylation domain-containing protein [Virgibacillus sp. NKC19-3]|uniref:non-ribosomal peptide synthetase n=1 Tax=Virgibacillus saliphilus TaxID=2831674 RepID=UPI001C9A69AF|nr:non-ribosomal peptide synthetase [Virgibacillus sp. NKC19-3]MBY7142455.1 amino acid adenylation domain-containing protein [Virgibacillus sp. NKC19-3]
MGGNNNSKLSNEKAILYEQLLEKKGIKIQDENKRIKSLNQKNNIGKMSYLQQGIWFFNQINPNNPAYNIVSAVKIKGDLDSDVLKKSLEVIIQRHEILRTRFNLENGKPQQEVMSSIKAPFQIIKIDKQTKNIQQLLKKYGRRSFNLTADGPLFEVTLIRQAEFEHILVLTMHHIISDGWSMGILVREWITVYQSMLKKESHLLPDLDFQYKDYVNWQLEKTQIEAVQKDLVYWEGQLKNAPPLLELSTDYPRKPVMSYKGSIEYFEVPGKLTKQLKQLARESDATLYMVLLGTFKVLLHRYSGQDDILVGSPVSGRTKYETENLIGLFINTLVLRTNMKDNPRFVDFLEQVSGTMLEAFAHQNAPFDKVVEVTKPERSSSYGPLIQSLFTFHNEPRTEIEVADLGISPMNVDIGYTQFDVSLTIQEGFNGELLGAFEYSTDLFKPETIQRMVKHYCNLLQSIVKNPMKRIGELTLLSKKEEERLIVDWNNTEEPFPEKTCIHELIEEQVKSTPLNTAVIYENEELTYKELNERANQLGHYLRKSGVTRGQAVGIYLNRSPEMLISIFGILKAGGCFVPLDPSYPKERIAYMIEDAKVEVIVTNQKEATYLNGVNIISLQEEVSNITEQSIDNLSKINTSSDVAYIIYTSGSTGKPKGVMLLHNSTVNLIKSFERSYKPDSSDKILPLTSISSASFIGEILPLLNVGGSILLTDYYEMLNFNHVLEHISKKKITIISSVPSFVEVISHNLSKSGSIRLILIGGEPLIIDKIKEIADKSLIVNSYGLTETTVCATYYKIDEQTVEQLKLTSIPIGKPIMNTEIYILDKYGQIAPIGCKGEINISGYCLAKGYLNRQLNEERFIDNLFSNKFHKMYKTGDYGKWLGNGDIEYLGRADQELKIRGYRINPVEIEYCLRNHVQVKDSIVRKSRENELEAYVLSYSGKPIDMRQVRNWIKEKLPSYMVPNVIFQVKEIPLNSNGKIDLSNISKKVVNNENNSQITSNSILRSRLENEILKVWSDYLNVKEIDKDANFFDIGGHSLMLAQIFNALKKITNIEFSILDMFNHTSISSLAEFLSAQNKGNITQSQVSRRAFLQRESYKKKNQTKKGGF